MFITKKKHNRIIEHKDKTINDYYTKIVKLEKELEQSKDVKSLLEKFSNGLFTIGRYFTEAGLDYINGVASYSMPIPDNVLQYTEDILGGKVIKQEGTKCLVVDKNGNVKTGLTKQKVDKGYSYKLVRE